MEPTFKNTIDRLPEILLRNAPSMMKRMVATIQQTIAQDGQLANASYSALLLKVSEPDLVREFEVAMKKLAIAIERETSQPALSTAGLSLSLEPLEAVAAVSEADFLTSTAQFDVLSAHAKSLGVTGVNAYKKDLFVTALKNAFTQAHIDGHEVAKLMPYALRALNTELVNIYGKLNAVQRDAAPAPQETSAC